MPTPISPTPAELADRLTRCAPYAIPWKGVIYRAASPQYATSKDLVTGIGAMTVGGRWNPPGAFPTVYGSLEPETAFAEALAQHRYYAIPVHLALPKVIAAIHVRLSRVLDLSDQRVSSVLLVGPPTLADLDWRRTSDSGIEPQTQALGRAIHHAGWEASLVPSAARKGSQNLLIFPDNLAATSSIRGLGTDFVHAK